jgi:hypothetical protein
LAATAPRRQLEGLRGEGPPDSALSADLVIGNTPFDSRLHGGYPDSLLAQNPTDQTQIKQHGGVATLSDYSGLDPAQYAAGNIPSLVPFPLSPGRNAIQPGTGGSGYIAYDASGILAADEWSVQVWVKPVGADILALSAVTSGSKTGHLLSFQAGHQYFALAVDGNSSPKRLTATLTLNSQSFLAGGSLDLNSTYLDLATGDIPADTWTAITVSYDQTYGLTLILGGDSNSSFYYEVIQGTAGLISAWAFDSGSTTEDDQFGPNPGTYTLPVTLGAPGAIKGETDAAARFAGTTGAGYLNVGNAASLQLSTGTIEGWVKLAGSPNLGTNQYIAWKDKAWSIYWVDGILYTHNYTPDTPLGSVGSIGDHNWHHVALTFQSGVASGTKLWLDGAVVLTTTITVLNQTNALKFGVPKPTSPSSDVQMSLDEWNVYSTVLTASDMAARVAFSQPRLSSSGSASAINRAWCAEPGIATGIIPLGKVLSGPPGYQNIVATVPAIYRYSRYKIRKEIEAQDFNPRFIFRDAPKISVDVDTAVGAWPSGIGGVVDHDTDYPGPLAPTSLGSTGNAQWAMLAEANCSLVRCADNSSLAPITNLSSMTIDFTAFDAFYQRIIDSGNPQVHGMVGFTPAALGGSYTTVPSDTTKFAQWASACVGRMLSLGVDLVSLSFWNEPENQWGGNLAQFKALWLACAQKIALDNPTAPKLGTTDSVPESYDTSHSPNYLKGTIDQAVASGLTLGGAFIHAYDGALTQTLERVDSVQAYLASVGQTCKVRLTEYASSLSLPGGGSPLYGSKELGYTLQANLIRKVRESPHEAARDYALLYELLARGVDVACYYALGAAVDRQGLLSGTIDGTTGLPRPFPLFNMFQLLWKHSGDRVTAMCSWPGLRGLCTEDNGTITLTYGVFAPAGAKTQKFDIEWSSLPSGFRWKQWRLDSTTANQGPRLPVFASGKTDTLPHTVELGNLGVGAIQITP